MKNKLKLIKHIFTKSSLIYFLELIVLTTMSIMLVLTFLGVGCVLLNCFEYKLSLNYKGLVFFINSFSEIFNLIASSLAVIGLFFAIERINLMSESNDLKASETWKKQLDENLNVIRTANPYMAVYFEQIADKIYKYLYQRNFVIHNKIMLRFFMWKFIDDQINLFEKKSKKFIFNNQIYTNENEVYSEIEIKIIIDFIFRLSYQYEDLQSDFESLYHSKVKAIAIKNILDNSRNSK